MRHDDGRQVLGVGDAGWQCQVARNLRAVSGGEGDCFDGRQLLTLETRTLRDGFDECLLGPVEDVPMPGVDIAAGENQQDLLIGAGAQKV